MAPACWSCPDSKRVLCQINEDKEARRRERARLLLAGHSFSEDDDPFEGLTPEVGQAAYVYVAGCTLANDSNIIPLQASSTMRNHLLIPDPESQEIQQYVQKETAGASHTDPFEARLHLRV